ncbi:MAG: pantoate--beta-alanine ligase, partial [Dysgonamonadaceae bacterium]|nr:pantoate--beta-alanine ligase [Dysgonamonadaceae bacterium]
NQRKEAGAIYRALFQSKDLKKIYSVDETKRWVIQNIDAHPDLKTEYFEIVDGITLQAIKNWEDTTYPVGCIAVFAGNVRLIDNMIY